MNRPADMNTISNTKIDISLATTGDRVIDEFALTPSMSTYLLAFIVSKYNGTWDTGNDVSSTFGIYVRPEAINVTSLSLEFGQSNLGILGTYLGMSYYTTTMNKMDMAAIPDFSAGGEC